MIKSLIVALVFNVWRKYLAWNRWNTKWIRILETNSSCYSFALCDESF